MSIWPPLRRALAQLRQDNIALPVWWRDDDAEGLSPQLDQLLGLSDRYALPVHLAVVPARSNRRRWQGARELQQCSAL